MGKLVALLNIRAYLENVIDYWMRLTKGNMSHSQAEITQGQRQTHPHGQLDPDQQTGLEWVAVISNIKLRHDSF